MEDKPQGSTLLYAVLVLAAVVASSVVLSDAIFSSLKQVTSLDKAIQAYYVADSAVEDSLYRLRVLAVSPGALSASSPADGSFFPFYTTFGSWTRSATAASNQIVVTIPANKTMQLDLYNPAASLQNLSGSYFPIKTLLLSWGPTTGSEWLEVSSIGWKVDGSVDSSVVKQIFGPSSQPATITLPNNDDLYKVRIKALYDTVYSLTITAKDQPGLVVPLPGKIVIKATGSTSNTNQAIEVTIKDPSYPNQVSGLYDYVIFSEDSLIK